jgi:hypothetical protein
MGAGERRKERESEGKKEFSLQIPAIISCLWIAPFLP